MNADIDMIERELRHIGTAYGVANTVTMHNIWRLLCQVRETLEALEAKQKIWEAKEASQEAQPEQDHSTQHKDQKLPEKEQSQRIRKTSNKQYIVSYPVGTTTCLATGMVKHNCDIADMTLDALNRGDDVTMPNTWKVQVIDL